jgi:protocatechuate 3,4-dioxygenase beta subunit
MLGLLGAGSLVAVTGGSGLAAFGIAEAGAGPVCTLTPEAMEGPYYRSDGLKRSDIREGRGGELLRLVLTVVDATTCDPIQNAKVDIWHADRQGNYSGFGATAGDPTFLRGFQRSDAAGRVRFVTTFPGWYPGRTAHIHVKVHTGGSVVHTGQLYFPQRFNDRVYAQPRYQHAGVQVTNHQDGIFNSSGGAETKLTLSRPHGGGYKGVMTLAVQR